MEEKTLNIKDVKEIETPEQLKSVLWQCIDLHSEGRDREALSHLRRILAYPPKEETTLAQDVEDWVTSTQGWFTSADVHRCLQVSTREDKKNVHIILRRLVDSGKIIHHLTQNARWRRIILDLDPIDWENAPTKDIPLLFPFQMEQYIEIYPGNTIVIAGVADAGKTCWMLNFIKMNMDKYEIHYFISEMGDSELRLRTSKFEDKPKWNFFAWERSIQFDDVIRPNAINIIDHLETIGDEFYKMGSRISEIQLKLGTGIAIIAIQKNPGALLGRGGAPTTDKPRLYLTLDSGKLKILKAKNWRGTMNPNGLCHKYKIVQGAKFIPVETWYRDNEDEWPMKQQRAFWEEKQK